MEIVTMAPSRPSVPADAVARLYTDLHRTLLKYIRSKISSKEDGEDILHNVFVKISENLDALSGKDNIKNWVFIITRNAIIDYYRQKGLRKSADLSEELAENTFEELDHDATQGMDQCLAGFIDQLPEAYRPVLIDSELKGIKQKDLADKYHLAYSSLRSRVQRGREKVKQQLLDCCRLELDRWGNILEATGKCPSKNSCNACDN
jgi:RNA polymerase sigma-70 factor (ECF subfamily)